MTCELFEKKIILLFFLLIWAYYLCHFLFLSVPFAFHGVLLQWLEMTFFCLPFTFIFYFFFNY